MLTGPTSACGVEAVLNGSPEAPGLSRILEGYSVIDEDGATDAAIERRISLSSSTSNSPRTSPDCTSPRSRTTGSPRP